jgi:predicted regulator of Ras-like GTPase activity (Roadblock/LC7/MglB family)
MFLERLHEIVGRIDGTLALAIVGRDGIAVESVCTDSSLDLEMLAAELVAQLRAIAEDQRDLSNGPVQEFSVATDRRTLMVSSVAQGYYLLLVLGQQANLGKARFELRRAPLLFEGDLA